MWEEVSFELIILSKSHMQQEKQHFVMLFCSLSLCRQSIIYLIFLFSDPKQVCQHFQEFSGSGFLQCKLHGPNFLQWPMKQDCQDVSFFYWYSFTSTEPHISFLRKHCSYKPNILAGETPFTCASDPKRRIWPTDQIPYLPAFCSERQPGIH